MMVSRHIVFSIPPSLAVYFITRSLLDVSLFLSGAVLMDFDHYLDYVIKKRGLGLRKAYRYNLEQMKINLNGLNQSPVLNYFHTIEFFVIISVMTLVFPLFKWLLPGMLFHIALDLTEIFRKYDPKIRTFSIIRSLRHRR
jgi:hypothetical protein